MDIEAVKAFLATDEGKAILDPMIDEAKQPLLLKRDELLGKIVKYKPLEEFGEPETIAAQLAALKAAPPKKDEPANKSFEELETHLRGELQSKEDKLNQFKTKFVADNVQAQLTQAIATAKGVPELLTPIVKGRVNATMNDEGNIVIEVLTKTGEKMYKGGNPATLNDLIDEIKSDAVYGRAFESTGASGSGTRPSDATTTGGVILDPKDPNYSMAKALAYYKRHPNAKPKSK